MSNDDLDTLRPEVQKALDDLSYFLTGTHNHDDFYIVRAELLRLTDEYAALKAQSIYPRAQLLANFAAANERAEKAEAELAEARETIKRLNRRVQIAEAGVAEKVKASAGRSLGRAMANAAADAFMHERDEAQAELAALQARIDALMLEFCPEDMTEEQVAAWSARQRVVDEPQDDNAKEGRSRE